MKVVKKGKQVGHIKIEWDGSGVIDIVTHYYSYLGMYSNNSQIQLIILCILSYTYYNKYLRNAPDSEIMYIILIPTQGHRINSGIEVDVSSGSGFVDWHDIILFN
jgi:hypothetical protein